MMLVRGVSPRKACDPGSFGPSYASTSVRRMVTPPCGDVHADQVGRDLQHGTPEERGRQPRGRFRRRIVCASHTTGSYMRSATRSFRGISALSVILMCSGHTSVQHLVMLQCPDRARSCARRSAVGLVERVHVELGDPHQVAGAGEDRLVVLVVADDVAGVLAQEALDALAELLPALNIDLLHAVVARLEVAGGAKAGTSRAFRS